MVKVINGTITEVGTRNIYMRKSLRVGLQGAVDNTSWGRLALAAAASAAIAAGSRDAAVAQYLDAIILNRFG